VDRSVAERRAFVAFVRAHHPDVGGDPDVFRAGLDRFRAGPEGDPASPAGRGGFVEIHRRRRGPAGLLDLVAAGRRRRRRPPRVR
jgi:hypothetical protein